MLKSFKILLFFATCGAFMYADDNKPLCFPIDRISFYSLNSYLYNSDSEIDLINKHYTFIYKLSKPYINKCLDSKGIVSLLSILNENAIKKGYITTRFGIGEQDLSSRELEVRVQIGKVGNIDYQSNKNIRFFNKDFDIKEGDILNLKKLEQGISNLNRISSLNTKMQILPSYSEDSSDIKISINKIKSPFSGSFSFDNGGVLFDNYQNTLLLKYENPFKLADIITLYFLGAIPFDNKDIGKNHSFYSSLSYSVPVRRFLLESNFSYSFNAMDIPLANFTINYNGRSFNLDSKLSYALIANAKHNVSVGLGFGARMQDSFIEDVELLVQRQRILQYSLFSQYIFTLNPYKFIVNLSLLNGFSLPNIDLNIHDKGFSYVLPTINLYAYVPFSAWKFKTLYNASIKTQVAQDRLYANEQMLIGGRYAVRGFHGLNLSGQIGVIAKNDLNIYIPTFGSGIWHLVLVPSAGFDLGYIRNLDSTIYSNLSKNGIFLIGGGVGLQAFVKYLNTQVWYNFPLYSPYKMDTQNLYLSISANF